MTDSSRKTYEFQSEVRQLLDILVYSLYQNKDVFLRELVSNAVDALNKVRFAILTGEEVEDRASELRIDIGFQKSAGKLIVEDNGVGMSREELIQNLGTIAHSGTAEFLKKLTESKGQERLDLIGKFGVGFYSSFMVAEEIRLTTRTGRAGDPAWLWTSRGGADYTIEEAVKKQRGTRIELVLKKDEKRFLEESAVRAVLNRYSRFVPFPVYIEGEKLEVMEALWTQPKSALKDKDYIEFYKFLENPQEEPDGWLHLASDAPVQFSAILFIPGSSHERFGMFQTEPGVDLYSRKILIQKGSQALLPEYLRFVEGVVDSEDIPLNISRETIQSNLRIEKIRKHLVKQLLAYLQKMKEKDRPRYLKIYGNFSRFFKEGAAMDFDNRDKLARLLLFFSSVESEEGGWDLQQYVERMKPGQKEIYYASGRDRAAIAAHPALEAFRKKDLEVLYLDDPVDELVMTHLGEFEGRPFRMAGSADIRLEREETEDRSGRERVSDLIGYLKSLYGDKVEDVRLSSRLVDSPCLLVQPQSGPSLQVEKILKMADQDYTFTKKVLEINPGHSLIREMARIYGFDPGSRDLRSLALQMLDNQLLREGVAEDVESAVARIQEIMLRAARAVRPAPKTPARRKAKPKAGGKPGSAGKGAAKQPGSRKKGSGRSE